MSHSGSKAYTVLNLAALGEEIGLCSMHPFGGDNVGTARVNLDGGNIPILTIDCLGLNACDLIQLDVENFEEKVINGAKKTIEKFSPVVIMESVYEDTRQFLASLGYVEGIKTGVDLVFYKDVL